MDKNRWDGEKRAESLWSVCARRKFLKLGVSTLGAVTLGAIAGCESGGSQQAAQVAPSQTPWYPNDLNAVAKSHLAPVTLPANLPNAIRASDEIVAHYARELNSPSALIHAVRAFGKDFKLTDGSNAVDHLCSRYFSEKEVNGKKYIFVPREYEVHDFSFLKTLLEAGVSPDQPITVGQNKYTLRDLGESAKALFRFDPGDTGRHEPSLMTQHIAWQLIALAILIPPSQPEWKNAYGETINLNQVIDGALLNYEGMCDGLSGALERGEDESLDFRKAITKHSCFGMHTIYALMSCLKNGYAENRLKERVQTMYDLTLQRLSGDSSAIDREANAAKGLGPDLVNRLAVSQDGRVVTKGMPPAETIEVMRIRSQIRFLGHAFEGLYFAQLHNLFKPTPAQKKRFSEGENLFFDYMVKQRAIDLAPYWNWYSKFVSNMVIATAHASRGLKLLTPQNPDKAGASAA